MPAAWPTRHAALLVSDAVPRRIATAIPGSASVQATYRSVFNIGTSDGLLTVASPRTGALPNGIQVGLGPDWGALGLRPGMVAVLGSNGVRVPEAGLEISLAGARRWSPRLSMPSREARVAAERWRGRSSMTWACAATLATNAGFGPLVRRDDRDGSGMVDVARPIVASLVGALERADRTGAAAAAASLIGLGVGLTPSGDDAIVGLEAALHALRSPMAGFSGPALFDVDERTTAVAATLLRHAAAGEVAERIHAVLAGLTGMDDAAIPGAVERAMAWGATSGTDCLLGILVGLDLATGARGQEH